MSSPRRVSQAAGPATRALPRGRDAAPDPSAEADLDRGLGELVDADRRDRAVRERRLADSRRVMERDVATLRGLLLDLAEQEHHVLVEHEGGRLSGRIVGLGDDVVVVEGRGSGERSLVRPSAVQAITTERVAKAAEGRSHRERPTDLAFRDLLAAGAEEGIAVVLHLRGRKAVLGGVLRAVGEDLLSVAASRVASTWTFVSLEHVVRVDLDTGHGEVARER